MCHVQESKLVLDVALGIGLTGALSVTAADVGGKHWATMSSRPMSRRARWSSSCVAGRSLSHSHELMVAWAWVPVSMVPPICATSASVRPSAVARRGQSSPTRSATSVNHDSETGICRIPAPQPVSIRMTFRARFFQAHLYWCYLCHKS